MLLKDEISRSGDLLYYPYPYQLSSVQAKSEYASTNLEFVCPNTFTQSHVHLPLQAFKSHNCPFPRLLSSALNRIERRYSGRGAWIFSLSG